MIGGLFTGRRIAVGIAATRSEGAAVTQVGIGSGVYLSMIEGRERARDRDRQPGHKGWSLAAHRRQHAGGEARH